MKQYMPVLLFVTLFITLLGFNAQSASATMDYNDIPGCMLGDNFSRTTGQACSVKVVSTDCQAGDLFSSVTGQSCSTVSQDDSSAVTRFNNLFKSSFKVGVRGDDVKALQQFLKDEGYYFGKVDGKYGRITARAVKDFQDDNDLFITIPKPITPPTVSDHSSVVISGVSGPQALYVNEQGTWTVTAYDYTYPQLHYGVDWGDSPAPEKGTAFTASVQQSATFAHTYSKPGIYNPTFLVTNSNRNQEQGASTSLSVSVRNRPTTFPAGCTSASGYSATTGQSCTEPVVVTPVIATPVVSDPYVSNYQYLPIDSNISGNASLVSANENKTRLIFQQLDWKWQVSLSNNGSSTKTIKRMVLVHNIPGEGWATDDSPINPVNKALYQFMTDLPTNCQTNCDLYQTSNLGTQIAPGTTLNFSAYGDPGSYSFLGGYLLVEFSDDTSAKISIAASSITPSINNNSNQYLSITGFDPAYPTNLTVGQNGRWVINAIDTRPNYPGLSYSANWGDGNSTNGQNTGDFTHSYSNAGTYSITFTVAEIGSGLTVQRSVTIIVSSSTIQPSITVISPNGGETLNAGQPYTINWNTTVFKSTDTVQIELWDSRRVCPDGDPACLRGFGTIVRTPNTGSYQWNVSLPSFAGYYGSTNDAVYKIKLDIDEEPAGENTKNATDFSNNNFTIIPSTQVPASSSNLTASVISAISSFPAGCSSSSGYSSTTGRSCSSR